MLRDAARDGGVLAAVPSLPELAVRRLMAKPLFATDDAPYSDDAFDVCRLLGYRFSPRIADLCDTRHWPAQWPGDPIADHGPLNPIARYNADPCKIIQHLGRPRRVAGSLVTHQIRAHDLLRMLGRDGHPTPLGQGFVEYGRMNRVVTG